MEQNIDQQRETNLKDPMGTETNNGTITNKYSEPGPLRKLIVQKSNKCNQCEYASSQGSNLRRHLKTHSGEKANKCNQCDYASSQASSLRTHLKTHSGEKTNKCNQCDYAFSQASNLRRHLKTHTSM